MEHESGRLAEQPGRSASGRCANDDPLMRSCRVIGLHQVDGIPTSPNVQDHQIATRRDDLRYGARGPGAGARIGRDYPWTAGHSRIAPDATKICPRPYVCWSGIVCAGWRVKDSNLGRHQPTDYRSFSSMVTSIHVPAGRGHASTVLPREPSR